MSINNFIFNCIGISYNQSDVAAEFRQKLVYINLSKNTEIEKRLKYKMVFTNFLKYKLLLPALLNST